MLFAEDSLVSHSAKRESNKLKTTPDISGRKCLGLSGNAGPLGLLEKMLLDSSDCAWTEYSLIWKAKATPQGRLTFQLARSEHRTSGSGYGLLHTPTAKANQMAPSMATRDNGSWGSSLWLTPKASDTGKGESNETFTVRMGDRSENVAQSLPAQVNNPKTWPKMWPTPTGMAGGEGVAPSHLDGSHGWSIGAAVNAIDPKSGGKLNPQWVAWLMGYPTEYLNSVPWETVSSRKSRKK